MSQSRARLLTISLCLAMALAACGKKPPPPPPTPPPPPPAEATPPPPPPPPPAPTPAPETRVPTEEEIFARMSLEELNAKKPLGDVFFALDSSDLADEARASLQKNAEYLKRWTSLADLRRGPLRRARHGGVQPGARRAPRHRGADLPDQPRRRRRSRDDRQQGQGAAVLQRASGELLLAEPPRPLPDHREVARPRRATRASPTDTAGPSNEGPAVSLSATFLTAPGGPSEQHREMLPVLLRSQPISAARARAAARGSGGAEDRPADHEVAGAGGDGLGRA